MIMAGRKTLQQRRHSFASTTGLTVECLLSLFRVLNRGYMDYANSLIQTD